MAEISARYVSSGHSKRAQGPSRYRSKHLFPSASCHPLVACRDLVKKPADRADSQPKDTEHRERIGSVEVVVHPERRGGARLRQEVDGPAYRRKQRSQLVNSEVEVANNVALHP